MTPPSPPIFSQRHLLGVEHPVVVGVELCEAGPEAGQRALQLVRLDLAVEVRIQGADRLRGEQLCLPDESGTDPQLGALGGER